MLQVVFSVGPLWVYITQLTEFSSVSGVELSSESTVVGQSPAGKNMSTEAETLLEAVTRQVVNTQQTGRLKCEL
jgi:hypothetical protein